MLIESVIPSALPFLVGIKHLSTFWARLNLINQASLRRSWNLTGFLRLGLRMPTHFDSREKPRKWKSDQRPERQVPQIFSFQSNLDSREKPSLWTRVSDALSDNGLAMTRSSLQS